MSVTRSVKRIVLAVLPAAAVGVVAPESPFHGGQLEAQVVDLGWSFEEGDRYRYRMSQETVMEMGGGMGESEQVLDLTILKEVREVDEDGAALIRVSHEEVRYREVGPMGEEQSYDSQQDEPPEEGQLAIMAALVNHDYEGRVGPGGAVSEIDGLDSWLEEAAEILAESPGPPEDVEAAREHLEPMMGEEVMTSFMEQATHNVPDRGVEPGDEWREELEVPTAAGSVISEYRFRLADVREEDGARVAVVELEGALEEFDPDAAQGPMAEMAGMLEATDSQIDGRLVFDVDGGHVRDTTVEALTTMEAMGQEVTVGVTTRMELLEEL